MFNRSRPFRLFFLCVIFSLFAVSAGRGAEPPLAEPPLEASLANSLKQAAGAEESKTFEAALRDALETNPKQKTAILRLAILLKPDWAAALVAASLATESDQAEAQEAEARQVLSTVAVAVAPAPMPNTEAPPEPNATPVAKTPPKPAFSGSADFGGILRTGNTENAGLKGQLKLGYKPDRWEHKGTAEAAYLRSEAETLEQRAELEYEVNYDITDKLFGFGLANYTDDRFSGFDFETLSSAGLGVRLFEGEPVKWEVTAGPSLRYAEFSDSNETETVPGARFTNDISWQVSDGALLANETELLWDRERVTLENDASLKLRIVEKLSGKLSLNTRYRSNAPEDTKSTDTTTRASIVYDF